MNGFFLCPSHILPLSRKIGSIIFVYDSVMVPKNRTSFAKQVMDPSLFYQAAIKLKGISSISESLTESK